MADPAPGVAEWFLRAHKSKRIRDRIEALWHEYRALKNRSRRNNKRAECLLGEILRLEKKLGHV